MVVVHSQTYTSLKQQQQCADGRSPLHLAALKGHSNVVEFLLSKQAWADAQDAQDNTALHLAARSDFNHFKQCTIMRLCPCNQPHVLILCILSVKLPVMAVWQQ